MKVCQQERALHDVKKEAAVKLAMLAMLHANAHLKIRNTRRYICISSPKTNSVCAFRAQEFSAAHLCRHACCTYVRSCTALKSKAARKFVHDSVIWSKSTNMSFSSAEKQDNRFFFRSSNPRFLYLPFAQPNYSNLMQWMTLLSLPFWRISSSYWVVWRILPSPSVARLRLILTWTQIRRLPPPPYLQPLQQPPPA